MNQQLKLFKKNLVKNLCNDEFTSQWKFIKPKRKNTTPSKNATGKVQRSEELVNCSAQGKKAATEIDW